MNKYPLDGDGNDICLTYDTLIISWEERTSALHHSFSFNHKELDDDFSTNIQLCTNRHGISFI